ncbi:MAG: hypothetical protein F6K00_30965 [Leptolyngbya sp. SIOISBB]|nr:hypothetical protein [Leptolyngbya sp. SIOISBB]
MALAKLCREAIALRAIASRQENRPRAQLSPATEVTTPSHRAKALKSTPLLAQSLLIRACSNCRSHD